MKKNKMSYYLILILSIFCLSLSGCDKDKDCTTDYTDAIQLRFKQVKPNSINPSIMDTVDLAIPFDSIYARRNNDPTKIIFKNLINTTARANYALPVHIENDNTTDTLTYFFIRGDENNKLVVDFRQRQEFVSEYCGMIFVFDQLKKISSDFQNTKVIYSELSRFNKINIQSFPTTINPSSN